VERPANQILYAARTQTITGVSNDLDVFSTTETGADHGFCHH
jgi:hypothetical protein